jgi:hypothetical protein
MAVQAAEPHLNDIVEILEVAAQFVGAQKTNKLLLQADT